MAGYYDIDGTYVSTHPADQAPVNLAAADHNTVWEHGEITGVVVDGVVMDVTTAAYAEWYAENYSEYANGYVG